MMKQLFFLVFFTIGSAISYAQEEPPIESIIEDIRALLQAGKLAEAENLTNRYIVDDPTNVDLLMMKGNVVLNKYLGEQQAQMSLRPNYEESIYKVSQLEKGPNPVTVDQKTAQKVTKLWRAAATLDPQREDLHLGVCQVYAIAGMKEELLAYLPIAKEKAAGLDELHIQLARYAQNLQERGDFEGGMEVYKTVAELYPEYPGLLSDIAAEYYYAGEMDQSKKYLQQSVVAANDDQATLGNAFFLSSLMGDYDAALKMLQQLPGNSHYLYEGLIKLYRGEKKWEKLIQKYLESNPDSTDAKAGGVLMDKDFQLDMDHYIGIIEHDLGDPTKILVHEIFRKMDSYLPLFNAGETYCFNKRYAAAVDAFSAIKERNLTVEEEDEESYRLYYAWALHENNQREASVEQWSTLLESSDFYKKSAAHWFIGKYHFDQGDKSKGREYFSKMAVDPSASKYATMCWNFMGE